VNKPVNSSIFKTSLLAALLTSAFGVHAAGLGKLTVYSGIGQPLKAEVALTATSAELNSLTAKLASHEAFKEAGIEYMSELSGLRFELVKLPNSQSVLKLSTDRPVNEPFLHFLVELNWSAGRMLREYTFLLDPPEMLQVAKPASIVAPGTPAVAPLPPSQATGQAQPPVQTPQARPTSPDTAKPRSAEIAAGEYQVRSGDFLGKIARAAKPESVSLDQMLVALFNDNREAFDGNNMNRLRAGKILRLPGADEVAKVDPVEARKLVISQAGEFNAYRRRVAAAAVTASPADTAPKQQVSGSIKPQVEDKSLPATKQDKLEVSRTEPAKSAKAVAGGSLEEDLIARDKALREASERIALLEKNIENLKQLVEIKSQTGAKLQQDSQAALPKPAEKPAEPAVAGKPADSTPATQTVKPEEAGKAAPVIAPTPAKPAEPALPATVQMPARKPAEPLPEPSFIEENPQIAYGGGGLVALLLGYLGYSSWRRKRQAEDAGEDLLASLPELESREPHATVISSAANESVDSAEVSIRGDFNDGGALTTEEIVDPVAEADVLMAYGRDRQAEEILLEGLKRDPTRTTIHMKLLDLYAKQENIAQFETIANELHKLNNGRGSDWDRTVSMAHILGLSGGVFLSAGTVAGAVPVAPLDEVEPSVTGEEPALQAVESVPSLPVEVAAAPPPAITAEVASLDFDLDLGTTSGPAIAAAAAAAEQAAATEKPDALDFDFDLGIPSVESPVAEEQQHPVVTADEGADAGLDFDLDLGSPGDTTATDALDRDATDFARSASPENVVDLTADMSASAERGIGEGVSDLKLDFDLELDSEPQATAPAATESSIESQNLSASRPTASEVDNSEAETKLELAHAYVEMGDLEGARELFIEVLNEGSSAQRVKAQAQLDQMDV
jgi:pilus assembly protein FimV